MTWDTLTEQFPIYGVFQNPLSLYSLPIYNSTDAFIEDTLKESQALTDATKFATQQRSLEKDMRSLEQQGQSMPRIQDDLIKENKVGSGMRKLFTVKKPAARSKWF